VHESGCGPSRQFAAARWFGRYQSEADIERPAEETKIESLGKMRNRFVAEAPV
jgi:hypothetical protein